MGKLLLALLLPLLLLGTGLQRKEYSEKITVLQSGQVIDPRIRPQLGHFTIELGGSKFLLRIGEMGGGTELWVPGIDTALSTDITSIGVINPHLITYCGSPVYGTPGVFLYDFENKTAKCFVPAENLNESYPDGTDYFEIDYIDLSTDEIFCWHVPDVDNVDFSGDWRSGHEYRIKFDGTRLTKTKDK